MIWGNTVGFFVYLGWYHSATGNII